ncbi:hypothetical protein FRUB_05559 [Fimbriiglobus ruber]|uniref:Uncharacterized protein n=1 Tax=Fimbriiglobus ruber TaxID=1908690 RepID=A0A225DR94_9BACT|nr:hypothetical protein FRUB_05559 [Fimbriiglobus ruber]
MHAAFIGSSSDPEVVKVTKGRKGYAEILSMVEKYLHEQTAR